MGTIVFISLLTKTQTFTNTEIMQQNTTPVYSNPNQPERFAQQKATDCERALRIEKIFDSSLLKDKVVLVTGSNRGIGLAIVEALVKYGAKVIATYRNDAPKVEGLYKMISGIDVTIDKTMEKLAEELKGEKVDILINNAGYFMVEIETIETCNFEEQLKMIDICSVGMLRVTKALVVNDLLAKNAKISFITSQGGSIQWRDTQNAGDNMDYGHHMSKAAANMAGKLLAIEMKRKGVSVSILHPGFNRTDMTKKYEHIWDIEGAVDSSIGAMRVLHEINKQNLETAGLFINCEDGLQIPW